MGKIHVLDYNTTVKIAAGEVIDRPASVVRELIDNAIDAGAYQITIRIEKGGKRLLEVIDNGKGMDAEDLQLCIRNHSTSKISSFSDIENLQTLGFRGEALSSIAEVSELQLSSRTAEKPFAYQLQVRYGKVGEIKESALNQGTAVKVQNLFGNLPARKKFLGSDSTETRHINREILKKALAYPQIAFEFYNDGKLKHHSPARKTFMERIADYYPNPIPFLLSLEHQSSNLKTFALITKPAFIRPNRMYQYFFVNQRAVEWKPFHFAVSHAYGNLIPKAYFPAVFFYLNIDPKEVDFNVHPMKREVRFRRSSEIAKLIEKQISEALFEEDGISDAIPAFTPYETKVAESIQHYFTRETQTEEWGLPKDHPAQETFPKIGPEQEDLFGSTPSFSRQTHSLQKILEYRFVGTLFQTYLLFENENQAVLIDQHAAHERIHYEKLKKNYQASLIETQELIPVKMEIPLEAVDLLNSHLDTLRLMGFQVEPFGDSTFIIRSTPVYIKREQAEEIVQAYVETLLEDPEANPHASDFIDHAIKEMACKSSVRSGDALTKEEAFALIKELSESENPYSCPHGRPTVLYANSDDFAKIFKRTGF